MRRLTELDLCVLGVIWRSGPLTAYGVRTLFRDSTTAGWSSSSGSIYPSIRRLLDVRLVAAAPVADGRGTQSLTVTAAGLDRLRTWLVELPPEIGTATPDPVRTRAQFITSVPDHDRRRFVETARDFTLDALRVLEEFAEAEAGNLDQRLDYLGTLGAVYELRARLEWLDRLLELVPRAESAAAAG